MVGIVRQYKRIIHLSIGLLIWVHDRLIWSYYIDIIVSDNQQSCRVYIDTSGPQSVYLKHISVYFNAFINVPIILIMAYCIVYTNDLNIYIIRRYTKSVN